MGVSYEGYKFESGAEKGGLTLNKFQISYIYIEYNLGVFVLILDYRWLQHNPEGKLS